MASLKELITQASDLSLPPSDEPADPRLGRAVLQLVESGAPPPPVRWKYLSGEFESGVRGVRYIEEDKEGHEHETWICSPLRVLALARDFGSGGWGRLLEWVDQDGISHRWSMPAAALQGDGVDLRKELATGGVRIAPTGRGRSLLIAYLQTAPTTARARCVDRLGWHRDTYLTAGGAIGQEDEELVYQSDTVLYVNSSRRGGVDEWKNSVARLAHRNSRLVFAISAAFAGPLLEPAGLEGGGVHFSGHSSVGKSTALRAAASVWGDPAKYVRSWRATGNGLEGFAAQHNDGLLVLDELHQCDPREAGDIVYMLSNGIGKSRARRDGTARRAQSWRLLYLSSGEHGLDERLSEVGGRSTAGQEVRLPSIPADAGAGMGIVENPHECQDSKRFVQALDESCSHAYGEVGREWLRELVERRADILATLPAAIEGAVRTLTAGREVSGQAARVARRFALIGLAGYLSTARGLTGWSEGEALEAARRCFADWLKEFGEGDKEKERLYRQVREFIERHGVSRFERVGCSAAGGGPVRNRAGFIRTGAGGRHEHCILPEVFRREVLRGFAFGNGIKLLQGRGWLIGRGGKSSQSIRTSPGSPPVRVYVLRDVLEAEAEAGE